MILPGTSTHVDMFCYRLCGNTTCAYTLAGPRSCNRLSVSLSNSVIIPETFPFIHTSMEYTTRGNSDGGPSCFPALLHSLSALLRLFSYTSYAVGSKPGVRRKKRPDSPPAGRNGTFFFRKIWLEEPNFSEKDKKVMLPQAKYAVIESKRSVCTHTA